MNSQEVFEPSEKYRAVEEAYLHLLQNQFSSIVNALQNPMEGIPKLFRGVSSSEIENSLRSADTQNLPSLQIIDAVP